MTTRKQFLYEPFGAVRAGFVPTFWDCIVVSFLAIMIVWKGFVQSFHDLRSDILGQSLYDLGANILTFIAMLIASILMPFLFWTLGIYFFYTFKTERERYLKQEQEIDDQI